MTVVECLLNSRISFLLRGPVGKCGAVKILEKTKKQFGAKSFDRIRFACACGPCAVISRGEVTFLGERFSLNAVFLVASS